MRTARLRRRRSLAQRALLTLVAALAFVISGVATGLVAYLSAATDVGVRTALADSATAGFGYQITTRAGEDAAAEHAAVSEALGGLLGDVPYTLHRSMVTGLRSVYHGADGPPRADTDDDADDDNEDEAEDEAGGGPAGPVARGVLAAYADLPDHAELVAGRWPEQAARSEHVPVALHAASATSLGLDLGDVISISDRGVVIALSVAGTWRPVDPADPFWFAEPLESEGVDARSDLLAVVEAADLAAIPGTTVSSRWRLVPVVNQLTAADVAVLRSALPRVPAALESDRRLSAGRIAVDDEWLGVLRDSDDRILAARSVAAVPLIVLGMASAIALGLVSRLLALLRVRDTAVLRARGASAGQLSRWAFAEALLVAGTPAVLGGLAAWAILRTLPEIGPSVSLGIGLATTAVVAAVAVATLTIAGYRAAGAAVGSTADRLAATGRGAAVFRAGNGVLVAGVAAFSLWQLHRYGSPTVVDATGISRIDPLVAAGPAVALLAGGLLGAFAVSGIAWVGQLLVERRSGLTGSLAVRQVARRPAAYTLPVVLVVLATATGTLAAGFAGTWSGLQEQVAAHRTGADVQVVLRTAAGPVGDSGHALNLAAYRAVAGVNSATPVVSVPRAAVADGYVELMATRREPDPLAPAVELPPGSRAVELDLSLSAAAHLDEFNADSAGIDPDDHDDPQPGEVRISLWLADADGLTSYVRADPTPVPVDLEQDSSGPEDAEPDTSTVRVELPRGTEPWRLVGLEIRLAGGSDSIDPSFWAYDYQVEVTALRGQPGGRAVNLDGTGGWTMVPSGNADRFGVNYSLAQLADGAGLRLASGGTAWTGIVTERLVPGDYDAAVADGGAVPLTATTAALERFGLAVGDEASLRVLGQNVPIRIEATANSVPGTTSSPAMVADLEELTAALVSSGGRALQPNQVWVELEPESAADGTVVAAVARRGGPDSLVLYRAAIAADLGDNTFARLSMVTFWVASGTALLLALTGLAAGAAVLARQRATELAILRSVGLSAAQQARTRRREHTVIAVLAVGLGAIVGWLVTLLTAGPLAAAATPGPLDTLRPVLRISPVPWAAVVGTALAAGVLVAVVHGLQVRRRVADGLRQEAR